jgi:hypothetical protein
MKTASVKYGFAFILFLCAQDAYGQNADDDFVIADRTGGVERLAPTAYSESYVSEAFCDARSLTVDVKKLWSRNKGVETTLSISSGAREFPGSIPSGIFEKLNSSTAVEFAAYCVGNSPRITLLTRNADDTLSEIGDIHLDPKAGAFRIEVR